MSEAGGRPTQNMLGRESWSFLVVAQEGTLAWMVGSAQGQGSSEYLGDFMEIDMRRYGLLGNDLAVSSRAEPPKLFAHSGPQPPRDLGADLARLFNVPPDSDNGTDYVVTALHADDGV